MSNDIGIRSDVAVHSSAGFMNFSNFTDAMRYAEIICKSSLCPKGYQGKPGDALVVIQMGMEIGLNPLQSLQGITVINGKATMWGDAMLALCYKSGKVDVFQEIYDEATKTYTCITKRKGDNFHTITQWFSMEDARKAGLLSKDNWIKHPRRMLQMRSRGYALRDAFTDVLAGLISTEEAQDYPKEALDGPKTIEVNSIASDSTVRTPCVAPIPEPMITDDTKATLMDILDNISEKDLESHGVKSLAEFQTKFKMPDINALTEARALKAIDYFHSRVVIVSPTEFEEMQHAEEVKHENHA